MKKLRIGVVGLGDISRVYLNNLKKYSDLVTIDACASRSLEKAQKKAEEFGIPHAYTCAEDLIEQADVDLILNLTTPDAHYRLNKLALTCGKHVYTEKPLGLHLCRGQGAGGLGTVQESAHRLCTGYLFGRTVANLPRYFGLRQNR